MKQLFSILVLCVILSQALSTLIIFMNYEMNKEYISKTLCENRNKPWMHCNGKCCLKNKLDKEEKREHAPLNSIKEKNELQFFAQSGPLLLLFNPFVEMAKEFFRASFLSEKHLASVFHPPQA